MLLLYALKTGDVASIACGCLHLDYLTFIEETKTRRQTTLALFFPLFALYTLFFKCPFCCLLHHTFLLLLRLALQFKYLRLCPPAVSGNSHELTQYSIRHTVFVTVFVLAFSSLSQERKKKRRTGKRRLHLTTLLFDRHLHAQFFSEVLLFFFLKSRRF